MKNIKDHGDIDRRVMELEAQSRQSWNSSSPLGHHANQSANQLAAPSSSRVETRSGTAPRTQQASPTTSPGQNNSQIDVDNDSTPKQQKLNHRPQASSSSQPTNNSPLVQPQGVNNAASVPAINQNGGSAVDKLAARANQETAVDGLLKLMKTTAEYDALDEWSG